MTQEEKAKAYDEALKVAEKYHNGTLKDVMETIFPELKESEGERVRKCLIEGFSRYDCDLFNGLEIKSIISWLEKQGEQKSVPDWMPKFLDELRSKKNYFDWDEHKDIEGGILAIINWMNSNYFNEKDGEQKPIGKPILDIEIPFGMDSELVEETMTIPKGCYAVIEDNKVVIRKGKKPGEWSKDDETALYDALWCCEQAASIAKDENDMGSIWSAKTWLKSLRPKNTWKPSDEQIEALEHFVRSIGESGYASPYDNNTKLLYSLLEQLKKLREE